MRLRLVFATALLTLAASPAALAWSALGHQMVGELAQRHISPAAQTQVDLLLAGEPDPTLAGVAAWADRLRDLEPERFKATSRWHYVNTPPGQGCGYEPARDCPDGQCVIGAIEAQRRILADRNQPLEARRDALKFIVHFVGDVHQPMHANNRDDLGGNRYQVSLRTDLQPEAYARKHYVDGVMGTNLHSIWDYYILGSEGLSLQQYSDRLDALPWPPMPVDGPQTGPDAWAGESCRLIDARSVYPDGHKMDQSYLDEYRPLAEQRVRQAAWRLAQILDADLGG
ncbi:S1/P1 nuclease [Luteimonas sp. 8-5]|uniref:S1/P1 nuclease n=1 Tax=Luteimonas sp. 8-5 TaxID=3039387 RepID=UPI002436EA70|nr:S1/P1 nuclease [Luteimonas sp. 8-5]MDG6348829.1 S1/P1 nuclease [Luteimonas sp. 8-5]